MLIHLYSPPFIPVKKKKSRTAWDLDHHNPQGLKYHHHQTKYHWKYRPDELRNWSAVVEFDVAQFGMKRSGGRW
jgi:hypothetical protein